MKKISLIPIQAIIGLAFSTGCATHSTIVLSKIPIETPDSLVVEDRRPESQKKNRGLPIARAYGDENIEPDPVPYIAAKISEALPATINISVNSLDIKFNRSVKSLGEAYVTYMNITFGHPPDKKREIDGGGFLTVIKITIDGLNVEGIGGARYIEKYGTMGKVYNDPSYHKGLRESIDGAIAWAIEEHEKLRRE